MTGKTHLWALGTALAIGLAAPAFAQQSPQPKPVAPAPAKPVPAPAPVPTAPAAQPEDLLPPGVAAPQATVQPLPPAPVTEPVMAWKKSDAAALLSAIEGIAGDGLKSEDYQPGPLRAALAAGEGAALDAAASKSFAWLVEDLRDGRTPMDSRIQWFAVDPDVDSAPTQELMATAIETHDVPAVLAGLMPTHPDYAVLKAALARTKVPKERALIAANMDRWRWLARDLGGHYLITNVPEYQLRLTVRDKIVRTYKTIVGKPGKTATPQLAETVEGVIFNPTWTVPQSIVKGEGLGARLAGNPAQAKREGYAVTKGADGFINVVQQPGPGNSLGLMKLDMPNPHAIFLHDTPARGLFNAANRALSHGCIRTERASELAITLAILQAGMPVDDGVALTTSGKYTRVPFQKTLPVYITYFTMAQDITGKLASFNDIYGRDAPILASFNAPRAVKTGQRSSNEAVVAIEAPGA